MDNASKVSCDILMYPKDSKYAEEIRRFQGCPTIAVTRGGRIFLAWYSGGSREPHMENYNLLIYSDDGGENWSDPVVVIPSNKEKCIHALDIQLWISPKGHLHVFWVQNNTSIAPEQKPECKEGQPLVIVEGYLFDDFRHSEWLSICEDPDAKELTFSQPRCLDIGFLRCKPLVLKNGRWINFNYDQESDRYGYSISEDEGANYTHYYGAKKLFTYFDEGMAYEKEDGSIRMFARNNMGRLAESISFDGGYTWQPAELSDIVHANSRFYVSRTPSGRVLLVINEHENKRTNMTVCLSEDDGMTWKYKRCIDTRDQLSYPDADFHDGKIYLTYDRERTGAKEILFTCFTEEDLMNEEYEFRISVVSKPNLAEILMDKKVITIMRGINGEKAVKAARAIADGGLSFLEVTFDPSGKISDEETAETIRTLNKELGKRLYIGAGTVITVQQVEAAYEAGAKYIISPDTDAEVIRRTKELGMLSLPGALTPTEIKAAHNAGADFVKIFPVGNLGAGYIKAVKASLNYVKYLAVGGVNPENMKEFQAAGAVGFGIGADILDKKMIDAEDYAVITELARKYTSLATD